MKLSPVFAAILSFLVPGLGQFLLGKTRRGAFVITVVLIVGNLNTIWLSIYANTQREFFSFILPMYIHDIMAIYGIVFWVAQAVDSYKIASKTVRSI